MTQRRRCDFPLVPIAVLASTLAAPIALAQTGRPVQGLHPAPSPPPFALTDFAASGSGCPALSAVRVVEARPGASTVAFLFSSFATEGRRADGDRALFDDSRCNISFELTPKEGYQVGLVNIRARGFADVLSPRDTRLGLNNVGRFERSYFWSSTTGTTGFTFPTRSTALVETLSPFLLEDDVPEIRYADCGAQVVGRADLRVAVSGAYNVISLNNADRSSGLTFNLTTRACSANTPRADPAVVAVNGPGTLRNACALAGIGTNARTKVCYGENGEIVSTTPDPNF
ncbi:MAG: DUF4360 domain-containing protein [Polyangiaceae bacterium]